MGIEPKTLQFGSDALPVHQAPLKPSVRISISTNVNAKCIMKHLILTSGVKYDTDGSYVID